MENDKFNAVSSIPDDIFGYDLRQHIWQLKYSADLDQDSIAFLEKLMAIKIAAMEPDLLKETFQLSEAPFPFIDSWCARTANPELIARALDVVVSLDKKQSPKYLPKIYESYLKVYDLSQNIDFLIRALNQVKFAPSIFKSKLDDIFKASVKIILELNKPFYEQRILTELVSIYGAKKCQTEFSAWLESQINDFERKTDFRSARFYIRTLHIIKAIKSDEYHIRTATNYEKEGDQHVSEKQPNTFYPTISQTFLKGLRQIRSTKGASALKKRLEEKVAREQKEDFKMLRVGGIKISPAINIEEIHKRVLKLGINSFELAYKMLFDMSITSIETIAEQVRLDKENEGGFSGLFSQTVKLSTKGSEIARQDLTASYASNARFYYRDRMSAYIHIVKSIMDGYGEINEAMTERLLIKSKSKFIPPNRLYIYVKGISAGFSNDFITAAHLLLPQIENSLRHLAEQHGITVTNYAAEIQFENLLGGLLEKISPLASPDLIAELKSFLMDGNNVNFRNETAHGLMDPALIHKYGQYLWWLTFKIIMQTKALFPKA